MSNLKIKLIAVIALFLFLHISCANETKTEIGNSKEITPVKETISVQADSVFHYEYENKVRKYR